MAETWKEVYPHIEIYSHSYEKSNTDDNIRAVPDAVLASMHVPATKNSPERIIAPILGRHPRHDQNEEANECRKDQRRVPRLELRGRKPLFLAPVPHGIDANDHEEDEDGIRIRPQVDEEIKRVAKRQRQNYNARHDPLQQHRRKRRPKWSRRRPHVRPGNHALPRALADLPRRADNYSHDVARSTDGDESWETTGRACAEDSFEEESSGEFAGFADLGCGDGGEVGDIGKGVEDEDEDEGERGYFLKEGERVLRGVRESDGNAGGQDYLDLVGEVEGVGVACVRKIYADQGVDKVVTVVRDAVERVVEVGVRGLHAGPASQDYEACDDDKEKDE
jgi:hypothetical protein